MQVTGTRQLTAWQRAEFPPVEQVTSGVWSVPVPIIDNPLRYVLSYLIEHDVRLRHDRPWLESPRQLAGPDQRAG